ncbi:MAG: DUF3006 domain-containing protein [Methanothrix sp.]|nr:MAG: DUF3006 domain-containing protein [Methanothrix sp.]
MRAVIDRVEGEFAVLLMGEKGEIRVNFPLSLLPEGCKESDVLSIAIERDAQATDNAKERTSSLMEKLKKKSEGKTGIIQGP